MWKYEKVHNINEKKLGYDINENNMMIYRSIIYVSNQQDLNRLILDECHTNPYATHHVYKKLIYALRKDYFWHDMKREEVEYVSKWLKCQQVNVEHQHPSGLIHPLPIPEGKWEIVTLILLLVYLNLEGRMIP